MGAEVYLKSFQTSMMEFFGENLIWNDIGKKTPS